MNISKLVVGLGFTLSLISASVMADDSVKTPSADASKSTLSGASTKPKNLDWELRNR
jgi:hypothetical protein